MGDLHVDDFVWLDTEDAAATAAFCIRTVFNAFGWKLKASKSREGQGFVALGGLFHFPAAGVRVIMVALKPEKRQKYCRRLAEAIRAARCSAQRAGKIAGAMQWAACVQFGQVSRAYLWVLYNRANHEHGPRKMDHLFRLLALLGTGVPGE